MSRMKALKSLGRAGQDLLGGGSKPKIPEILKGNKAKNTALAGTLASTSQGVTPEDGEFSDVGDVDSSRILGQGVDKKEEKKTVKDILATPSKKEEKKLAKQLTNPPLPTPKQADSKEKKEEPQPAVEPNILKDLQDTRKELMRIYKDNRDRKDWAEIAEMFGQALTKYAAAREGLRSNVDLSNIQLDKTDWDKKRQLDLDELKMGLQNVKEQEAAIRKDKDTEEDRAWRSGESKKDRDSRERIARKAIESREGLASGKKEKEGMSQAQRASNIIGQQTLNANKIREARLEESRILKEASDPDLSDEQLASIYKSAITSMANRADGLDLERDIEEAYKGVDSAFVWGPNSPELAIDALAKIKEKVIQYLGNPDTAIKQFDRISSQSTGSAPEKAPEQPPQEAPEWPGHALLGKNEDGSFTYKRESDGKELRVRPKG